MSYDSFMIRPTTVIEIPAWASPTGAPLTLASETFQHTGSFKFRAAYNVASKVSAKKLITASSGNFGQGLAYACKLLGKECIVVMPSTSAGVKIESVKRHGASVELLDVRVTSRQERLDELAAENPGAYIASPYDDELVIEGNASLGRELARLPVSTIIVPVGGGGLISGIITGLRQAGSRAKVIGAEPAMANDAARSLAAGKLVANESEPQTIADGARTLSVGRRNWEIIRRELKTIVEVPEEKIREAVRRSFLHMNLKCEPTGALAFAAVMTRPELFTNAAVCCVVSGGNVDPAIYSSILLET